MTIGRWLSRRDRAASVGSVFSLATAVAVVLLATSLLSATVFDPFPYRSAHELAVLSGTAAPSQGIQGLFGRFVARESTVFQAVEFFQMPETLRIGVERPLSVNAIRVSPGLTSALGVQFLAGRPPSSDREVALSEGLRQRLFGGAPLKSLGATVVISGVVHEIVGILPPKFFFPDNTVEVYLALNGDAAFNLGFVHALVRLKPPVAEALAREQLAALVRHYNRESGARAGAVLHPLPDLILGSQRQALWALVMWCVAMVLLATANVANLQITRVRARLPDLALRIAFGATPRSELVGLVIYLTFLAASGVVLGAGCASLGLAYLKAQQLREVIGLDAAAISLPASAVIGVTVWGALCAWALPSMRRLHSAGVANLLRTGGAGQGRAPSLRQGTWLLPVQLAVSIGLVILTTCLLLTFRQLTNADWGFSPSGVSIVEFDLPVTMARHVAEQTETVEAILSRVRQEPAVISAGVGYTAPFRAGSWKVVFLAADGASKTYAPLFKISPGYFRSLGTKMVAGRDFAQTPSTDGELPIIVGQHVAQVLWPNESAIGRRLRIMKPSAGVNAPRMTLETQPDDPVFAAPGALVTAENRERVVVGVVEDMRMGSLNLERRWAVYIDYRQQYIDQWYGAVGHRLVIRSLSEPATLARSVGKIIASLAAGATLGATHDLGALVDQSIGGTGSSKLVLLCLGGMDVVAFVLAAFGVYVLTRAVLAARQREYAIRLSLGCTLGVIRRHVATALTRGFATGLVLAGLGVYAGTQLLSQQLPLVFDQLWVAVIVAGPLVVAALLCPMFIVLRRIRLLNPWELLRD